MGNLEVAKFKVEQLLERVEQLVDWYRGHVDDPPRAYQLEQEATFDTESLVAESAKVILRTEAIPAELWKPFASDFVSLSADARYKDPLEKWQHFAQLQRETLMFIRYLADVRARAFPEAALDSTGPRLGEPAHSEAVTSLVTAEGTFRSEDHAGAPPDSPFKAVAQIVWQLPRPVRIVALVLSVLAAILFALWGTLPDDTKTVLINAVLRPTQR